MVLFTKDKDATENVKKSELKVQFPHTNIYAIVANIQFILKYVGLSVYLFNVVSVSLIIISSDHQLKTLKRLQLNII